jgi:hypothetical protein
MRRFKALRLAFITGCVWLSVTVFARADPVLLTSGTFDYEPTTSTGGALRLFGTGGFSLIGTALMGAAGPDCCLSPGATTQLHGFWGGLDVGGTVTYLGQTFTHLGTVNSTNNVNFTFLSSTFALPPAPTNSMTVTMSAPFALAGSFVGALGTGNNASPTVRLLFHGVGVGSLPFRFIPEMGLWGPSGNAHLQIGTTAEVVPEPGTLILVGLGIAGACYRRASRGAADRSVTKG